MNPICMSKHPDKTNTWCERVPDHDGPHRTVSGLAWGEAPDDMDGGVTAALIEKEVGDREDDVTLLRHDLALMEDRAIKVEQARDQVQAKFDRTTGQLHDALGEQARLIKERDDCQHDARAAESALSRLRRALDLPDTATTDDMVARIEEINCHDCVRDAAVIEKRVGFTAEDVDDAMVDRYQKGLREAWRNGTLRVAEHALRAALTVPTRPEGAEDIEALIEASLPGDALSDAQVEALADFLAERGVRVTEEERSERHAV